MMHEFLSCRTPNPCHDGDPLIAGDQAAASNERLGFFAHELRNHLQTAKLAWMAIKSGRLDASCATGAVLERSLAGLDELIDRSLAEVRTGTGSGQRCSTFTVADFVDEVSSSASLEAAQFSCTFAIGHLPASLTLHVDKALLFTALSNLLQNAFKFSGIGGAVRLDVAATLDRICITVTDSGPGLSKRAIDDIFLPFKQCGDNKTGLGLGLSIARCGIEAMGGMLTVEGSPGHGCAFSIDRVAS